MSHLQRNACVNVCDKQKQIFSCAPVARSSSRFPVTIASLGTIVAPVSFSSAVCSASRLFSPSTANGTFSIASTHVVSVTGSFRATVNQRSFSKDWCGKVGCCRKSNWCGKKECFGQFGCHQNDAQRSACFILNLPSGHAINLLTSPAPVLSATSSTGAVLPVPALTLLNQNQAQICLPLTVSLAPGTVLTFNFAFSYQT